MEIYIVYKGDFSAEYPSESDARPDILLVTTDENKANDIVKKLYQEYKENERYTYLNNIHDNSFTFSEDDNSCYGSVGVIRRELEKES